MIIFSLSILVSGKMSFLCEGVPLHTIKPGQMLNSIEWKAMQFDLDYQEKTTGSSAHKNEFKHQVSLVAEEDSMYVKLNARTLQDLKGQMIKHDEGLRQNLSNPHLLHCLDFIVSKDISQKMYLMNDSFDKTFKANIMMGTTYRSRKNPLFRSLSLDVLDTGSNGKIVTENWLSCDGRILQLLCVHDTKIGLPKSMYGLFRYHGRSSTKGDPEIKEFRNCAPIWDSDVAYVLMHSNPNLNRHKSTNWNNNANDFGYNDNKAVIPSLKLQLKFINRKSCKFVDTENAEKWDLQNAWNHCGQCYFCKGSTEEKKGGVHPSVKKKS